MYGISGLFMTKYTEEVMVDGKSIVIHFWYQENRNSPNWIISNQAEKLECVKGTLPFFARLCWGFFRIDLILYLLRPYWALLSLTGALPDLSGGFSLVFDNAYFLIFSFIFYSATPLCFTIKVSGKVFVRNLKPLSEVNKWLRVLRKHWREGRGWAGVAGRRAAVRPWDAARPSPDCALLAANQDKYETAAVHFHMKT